MILIERVALNPLPWEGREVEKQQTVLGAKAALTLINIHLEFQFISNMERDGKYMNGINEYKFSILQ